MHVNTGDWPSVGALIDDVSPRHIGEPGGAGDWGGVGEDGGVLDVVGGRNDGCLEVMTGATFGIGGTQFA